MRSYEVESMLTIEQPSHANLLAGDVIEDVLDERLQSFDDRLVDLRRFTWQDGKNIVIGQTVFHLLEQRDRLALDDGTAPAVGR